MDLAACVEIQRAMARPPEVFVRCASEFPYYPAVQQMVKWYREGAFGQIIEARFAIKHLVGPGPHQAHQLEADACRQRGNTDVWGIWASIPSIFRSGWALCPAPSPPSLPTLPKTRPDETGRPVPCETWDNAILTCEAQNAAGDTFPMQLEMKRMAPGCTNTVEYESYGLKLSAKFTTDDPNAIRYTQPVGREQAWHGWWWGKKRTLYPVITGSIFEFGFSRLAASDVRRLCERAARPALPPLRLLYPGRGASQPPGAHRRAGILPRRRVVDWSRNNPRSMQHAKSAPLAGRALYLPQNRQKSTTKTRRLQGFTTFCGLPAAKAFRFSTAMSISRARLSWGPRRCAG